MNNKMNIVFVIISLAVIFARGQQLLQAQQMPPEVQQIINDESSGKGTFLKSPGVINLKFGIPFMKCWLLQDSVDKLDTNTPISKLITTHSHRHLVGEWDVPLYLNGIPTYEFSIAKYDTLKNTFDSNNIYKYEVWHASSFGGGVEKEWDKILLKWPSSKGYHPILVEAYPSRARFVYIPEKDDYNLTVLNHFTAIKGITVAINTDTTYSTLTDSRKTLSFLKTHAPHRHIGISIGRSPK
jgi:hypothetical protein